MQVSGYLRMVNMELNGGTNVNIPEAIHASPEDIKKLGGCVV